MTAGRVFHLSIFLCDRHGAVRGGAKRSIVSSFQQREGRYLSLQHDEQRTYRRNETFFWQHNVRAFRPRNVRSVYLLAPSLHDVSRTRTCVIASALKGAVTEGCMVCLQHLPPETIFFDRRQTFCRKVFSVCFFGVVTSVLLCNRCNSSSMYQDPYVHAFHGHLSLSLFLSDLCCYCLPLLLFLAASFRWDALRLFTPLDLYIKRGCRKIFVDLPPTIDGSRGRARNLH